MRLTTILSHPLAMVIHTLFGSLALTYLQETAVESFKWIIPSAGLIIADLLFGVQAARYRGETVRASGAMRGTINKIFAYSCWIFVAAGLSISFGLSWLAPSIMAIVMVIEFISCLNNYLEPKKKRVTLKSLFRFLGKKTGNPGIEDIIEDIDEPKRD